jgi:uncharacterized NAD(P)/FAD-binding protein YdhS
LFLARRKLPDYDWHGVVDAVRPQANRVWDQWTLGEQRQFLRHLAPLWEVHRHRAPASTLGVCEELRAAGRLRVHRGRLAEVERDGTGFRVTYAAWEHGPRTLHADTIVDCTGPRRDIARSGDALIEALFEGGLARPGALAASADNVLTGAPGAAPIYALGTPLRGTFAESSGVREIRIQARTIAESLAAAHEMRSDAASASGPRSAVGD